LGHIGGQRPNEGGGGWQDCQRGQADRGGKISRRQGHVRGGLLMVKINDDKKRQIRDLMRQKISIEDQMLYAKKENLPKLEDDLYEIKDTLDKLTNGVWFEDMDHHVLQAEKSTIN
jgi:hypothetical protein